MPLDFIQYLNEKSNFDSIHHAEKGRSSANMAEYHADRAERSKGNPVAVAAAHRDAAAFYRQAAHHYDETDGTEHADKVKKYNDLAAQHEKQ